MSFESTNHENTDRQFFPWEDAIREVDTNNELAPFNDVITGKEPSVELRNHFVLRDVLIDGRMCDVYHWDQDKDGKRVSNPKFPVNRVFVHIKD